MLPPLTAGKEALVVGVSCGAVFYYGVFRAALTCSLAQQRSNAVKNLVDDSLSMRTASAPYAAKEERDDIEGTKMGSEFLLSPNFNLELPLTKIGSLFC